MNRHQRFSANLACVIDRIAEYIHDAAQRLLADRYLDRAAGIGDRHATLQALRRAHRNGADDAIAQLLLNFERRADIVNDECVIDLGNLARRELNVHNGANNLHSSSGAHF